MSGKFYMFDQNNSGGHFIVNDEVCHRVIIEADNKNEAIKKAEELGIYFNGCEEGIDCSCCGDRWYEPYDELTFPFEYGNIKHMYGESIEDLQEIYKVIIDEERNIFFNDIETYCQYLADKFGFTKPDARIYYKDETVKEIFTKGDDNES